MIGSTRSSHSKTRFWYNKKGGRCSYGSKIAIKYNPCHVYDINDSTKGNFLWMPSYKFLTY